MESSWEETKKRSKYHFDTNQWDPRFDNVIKVGHIEPNWTAEQVAQLAEESKAVTWRTRGDPRKASRPESELSAEDQDLIRTGYGTDYEVTNLNWNIPDNLLKIAEAFGLDDMMCRIHVQQPGQVWNLHLDKLEKWNKEDPDTVLRFMIQLTDWQQGHFWSYGNYHHAYWKAGDVTSFDWQNIPHSTANAGHSPRVTLQVTGVRTSKTVEFLRTLSSVPSHKLD
jgi:hypothetical protein